MPGSSRQAGLPREVTRCSAGTRSGHSHLRAGSGICFVGAILHGTDFNRWLSTEPDPRDVLRPFPSELLRMWPISTRVNSPMNDDEHLLDEIELPVESA
jgi:hypothetical protein